MKIHRNVLSQQEEETAHSLYQAIVAIQSKDEAAKFFDDLCTPTEIQAMADRWLVVYLIKSGMPYRQIYEKTGVSVTTVGRVARCILLGRGGYNLLHERLEKKKHEKDKKTKNSHTKKRSS